MMKKRILAFLLSVALCLSLLTVVVSADDMGTGEFCVDYDTRNGAMVQREENDPAYTFVPFSLKDFTAGNEYKFQLLPPNDSGDNSPVVYPVVYIEKSGIEPIKVPVSGNKFSYTPNDNTGFIIRVFWSQAEADYAYFGKQFMMEFSVEGRGTVSVSGGTGLEKINVFNFTKVGWDEDPGNVTITVTPDEGENSLESVWIEQEANGTEDYNALTNQESKLIRSGGTYTLDLSKFAENEGAFVNMRFRFTGWDEGGGEPQGLEPNKYMLRYSNAGSVTDIGSENVQNFTTSNQITWTLSSNPYRVEINVFGESGDHFEYNDGDTEHNSDRITVNNTAKTISFTPDSDDPFEVFIYWTGQDRFEQFGYNPDEEIQLQCRVQSGHLYSVVGDFPWCSFYDAQTEWESVRINVPQNTQSVTLTFVPEHDCEFDKAEFYIPNSQTQAITTVSENTYTWAAADFDKELNFFFKKTGEQPGPGPGPNPPEGKSTDYAGAKAYIEGWDLAYCAADSTDMITYMATELWNEGFCEFNGHIGEYTGMFKDFGTFKACVALGEQQTADSNNLLNLPYYNYTATLCTDDPATDAVNEAVVAAGEVYVLSNAKQFVVKDSADVCTVVDTTNLSGENIDIYVRSSTASTNHSVFGNGVCEVGGLEAATGDYQGAHVTQEHSGIDTKLGCRLAVFANDFEGVRIIGNVSAAPWGFAEIPIFSAGTSADPKVCEIYYGNDGSDGRLVTISSVADNAGNGTFTAKTIQNIAVDTAKISGDVASIANNDGTFTITFNSSYDIVPMIVTFSDDTTGYIEIHRVGLKIATDIVNGAGTTFKIAHGTDNDQTYSAVGSDKNYITASFYYNTGSITPTEPVSLFVTIVTKSGTVRSVVSRLNNNFIETTGSDKYADDFLLWSGTDAEYEDLVSVSAIVFDAGDGSSFGGVKVGSGAGVEWANN